MTDKKSSEKIFDIRTLEYSLTSGLISEKEYEKHLKDLPDEEGNYEWVGIEEEENEEEGPPESNPL